MSGERWCNGRRLVRPAICALVLVLPLNAAAAGADAPNSTTDSGTAAETIQQQASSAPATPEPPTAPEAKPAAPAAPPAATATPESPTAPAPPAATAPTTPPPPGTPPKNLQPIFPGEATLILGKKVQGAAGEDMGRVVDILVDGDGQPRAAVIDFGGFLGVGSRKIAVDWRLLQFRPTDHKAPIQLSVTRAEVQAAPEYKEKNEPAQVVAPPAEAPAAPNATK